MRGRPSPGAAPSAPTGFARDLLGARRDGEPARARPTDTSARDALPVPVLFRSVRRWISEEFEVLFIRWFLASYEVCRNTMKHAEVY